jgi:hypothetical protein
MAVAVAVAAVVAVAVAVVVAAAVISGEVPVVPVNMLLSFGIS